MRIVGKDGMFEVRAENPETGIDSAVFSHEDLDCILAFVQATLEWEQSRDNYPQVDLYVRYQLGHRAHSFSALHIADNMFFINGEKLQGASALFEHCTGKIRGHLPFRLTVTFNTGFRAFNKSNRAAEKVYQETQQEKFSARFS